MKTWSINVKLQVADSWVADGFDAKERVAQIEELLTQLLPYAYGHEFKITANILTCPKPEIIRALQTGEKEIKD